MLTTKNSRSPLRILEQSSNGALRTGDLAVVMARAGVGKTAFLVQVGIDHALRERRTLHVALGQDLDHVGSWYTALLDHLAASTMTADERQEARERLDRNRLIHASFGTQMTPEKLAEILRLYSHGLDFVPEAILVDGFDWSARPDSLAEEMAMFKKLAADAGAELWMTAQTLRSTTPDHPSGVLPPCDPVADLIDLAIFLEPEGAEVSIRLLKDHEGSTSSDTNLVLHPDTMQIGRDDEEARVGLPARAFTLITGSAKGSEQAFGEAAERWGLHEVNFTFAGRDPKRTRGLEILSEETLDRGAVNSAYITAQLHRSFPKTETFRRIFKMIWHQVATAGEVFAIGFLQADGTVRGGTGWGVELARHFGKRVTVFDQDQERWFVWQEEAWQPVDEPIIRRTRFAGTGTRFPSEAALRAITELYTRSFGERKSA